MSYTVERTSADQANGFKGAHLGGPKNDWQLRIDGEQRLQALERFEFTSGSANQQTVGLAALDHVLRSLKCRY